MKELVNIFVPKISENKFLSVHRSSLDKMFGDMNALPGGGIEDGESVTEAAKREFKEETGIELIEISTKPVMIRHPVLLGQQVQLYVHEGQINSEEFSPLDHDISSVEWVEPTPFIESLRKFGYPESEIEEFIIFLKDKGFRLD